MTTNKLHAAICDAVGLMNTEVQTGANREAHTILRLALVDFADAALDAKDTALVDAPLVRKVYDALNVRWRDVIPGDEFENENRAWNNSLSQILSTFQNICKSEGVNLVAAHEKEG